MKKEFKFRKKALYDMIRINQIKVHGEIGARIDLTIEKNLLALDLEKDFLEPFQQRNGANYIGLGKNLEGVVHFTLARPTAALLKLKKSLIAAVLCSADPDGYIGTMPAHCRLTALWDCHEAVHIVTALLEDWLCFGEKESLQAARKLMDLLIQSWEKICAEQKNQKRPFSIHLSSLGMEYALLQMYKVSGKKQYLNFACQVCGLDKLDWPIQLNRFSPLFGHSYLYLHHCRCQLELYGIQPEAELLRMSRRALSFMLAGNGMSVSGGVGQAECWTDDQDVGGNHAETCSTVYQLRLFAEVFRLTGDARCGDLIERTIYNTLWASQSPDGRQIRYYTPLEGKRSYYRDTYCCPNNFRRFMAELPGMIYFTGKDSLVVNLYTESDCELSLGSRAVRITQKTAYPEDKRIQIKVFPIKAFHFALRLRIPLWCRNPVVRLNGETMPAVQAGSLFEIARVWQSGDMVDLELPLEIRFIQGRQRQYGLAAVMFGPLLYCLAPASQVIETKGKSSASKVLADWDAAALSKIRLLPSSAEFLPDFSIRVLADLAPGNIGVSGDYELHLTRFPDPEGRCVYFHLGEPEFSISDELLAPDKVWVPAAEIVHGPLPVDF